MTSAHPPVLWLLRHGRTPVCLVAAADRATACRLAHALAPDVPFCDFSALQVGTPKRPTAGIIADLRQGSTTDDVALARPTARPRRRSANGHIPTEDAPTPALAAFEAACRHFGVHEHVARNSHAPVATRLRWAIWSATLEAGYNQKQAAAVTGHDHGTVSHTIIGIEAGTLRVDGAARAMYEFAAAAMRQAVTGEEMPTRGASMASPC